MDLLKTVLVLFLTFWGHNNNWDKEVWSSQLTVESSDLCQKLAISNGKGQSKQQTFIHHGCPSRSLENQGFRPPEIPIETRCSGVLESLSRAFTSKGHDFQKRRSSGRAPDLNESLLNRRSKHSTAHMARATAVRQVHPPFRRERPTR